MRVLLSAEDGVSEVVGEMLMIALVLILIAIFSASLSAFVPLERDPSVTIMMNSSKDTVTLWHKGGDWVKKSDLTVIIQNKTVTEKFAKNEFELIPDAQSFDLGARIIVTTDLLEGGDEVEVRLVTPRAMLFTGRVR